MEIKNEFAETTKCLQRKDLIKYCIIPKKSKIQKGDPVIIIKLNPEEIKKEALK